MNVWKFIQRICLIASVALVVGIVVRLFLPLIDRQKACGRDGGAAPGHPARGGSSCAMLKLKQEKLQEDPRFIEKIAREELGYAKPGETIFRFVDEENP
jgi:hypothetical protein